MDFSALSSLKKLGCVEVSFTVSEMNIVLSSISMERNVLIFRLMSSIGSDSLEYIHTYKLWTVAYAIAQLNDFDLRNVKAIPSGKDKDGKDINLTREEYLFNIVSSWTSGVLNVCFKKYSELIRKEERVAEAGVKYEVLDIDAEIKRMQDRIDELKKQKGTPEEVSGDKEIFKEELKADA
jgi:hypothetical protein